MDILLSKDEKIGKLEKRIALLERKVDRKFERGEENFEFFKSLVAKMQKENVQLKKDRDYLLGSYSKLLDRLYDSALSDDLRGAVESMRRGLKENFTLIQEAAREDLVKKKR
jgi:hypothetical protein